MLRCLVAKNWHLELGWFGDRLLKSCGLSFSELVDQIMYFKGRSARRFDRLTQPLTNM